MALNERRHVHRKIEPKDQPPLRRKDWRSEEPRPVASWAERRSTNRWVATRTGPSGLESRGLAP
eukprot:2217785-Heterocapsa_arctica.AAC.1